MTPPQKRAAALGILLTLLGVITMPLVRTTWQSKVSTTDFEMYAMRDSIWKVQQRDITLEILCELKPADRRCR